jgi:hypothetical protein
MTTTTGRPCFSTLTGPARALSRSSPKLLFASFAEMNFIASAAKDGHFSYSLSRGNVKRCIRASSQHMVVFRQVCIPEASEGRRHLGAACKPRCRWVESDRKSPARGSGASPLDQRGIGEAWRLLQTRDETAKRYDGTGGVPEFLWPRFDSQKGFHRKLAIGVERAISCSAACCDRFLAERDLLLRQQNTSSSLLDLRFRLPASDSVKLFSPSRRSQTRAAKSGMSKSDSSTPTSANISRETAKSAPHRASSRSGCRPATRVIPDWMMARAQSMHGNQFM